jgi:hypothetical protein
MWFLICQYTESNYGYIVCRNPRDFSIGACGEEFVVLGECFVVAVAWFWEVFCLWEIYQLLSFAQGNRREIPINQLGLNTVHSAFASSNFCHIFPWKAPPYWHEEPEHSTNLLTPFSMAKSIKALRMGAGLLSSPLSRYTAEMSEAVEKGLFHVEGVFQSKWTVGWVEEAEGPRREVKRMGMEAEWRREARRRDVLPVPPVSRMVMIETLVLVLISGMW